MRKETGLHLDDGHARGAAAEIDGRDGSAGRGKDGYRERAQAYFIFLVAEGVAVATDVAKEEAELLDRGNGACGVGREDNAGEILFELLGGQIGEKDAAHAGAVGGKTAADVEIDGHDAVDGGAGYVNDVVAVEGCNGEGLAEGRGHALEDGLGCTGESVGSGVGVGERQHAGTKRVS